MIVACPIRTVSLGPVERLVAPDDEGLELAIGFDTGPVGVTAVRVVAVPVCVTVLWLPFAVWAGQVEAELDPEGAADDEGSDAATKGLDELPPVPVVRSSEKVPVSPLL